MTTPINKPEKAANSTSSNSYAGTAVENPPPIVSLSKEEAKPNTNTDVDGKNNCTKKSSNVSPTTQSSIEDKRLLLKQKREYLESRLNQAKSGYKHKSMSSSSLAAATTSAKPNSKGLGDDNHRIPTTNTRKAGAVPVPSAPSPSAIGASPIITTTAKTYSKKGLRKNGGPPKTQPGAFAVSESEASPTTTFANRKGLRKNSGPNIGSGAIIPVSNNVAEPSAASTAAATTTKTSNLKVSTMNSGPNTQPGAISVSGNAASVASTTIKANPKGLSKNCGPNNKIDANTAVGGSWLEDSKPDDKGGHHSQNANSWELTPTIFSPGLPPLDKPGLKRVPPTFFPGDEKEHKDWMATAKNNPRNNGTTNTAGSTQAGVATANSDISASFSDSSTVETRVADTNIIRCSDGLAVINPITGNNATAKVAASANAISTAPVNGKGLGKNSPNNRATQAGAVSISRGLDSVAAASAKSGGLRQATTKGQSSQVATSSANTSTRPEAQKGLRSNSHKKKKGSIPSAAIATQAIDSQHTAATQPGVVCLSGSSTTIPGARTMRTLRGLQKNQGPGGSSNPSTSPVPVAVTPPTFRGLANNKPPTISKKKPPPQVQPMNVPTIQQDALPILNNPETEAWIASKTEMKNRGPNYLPYLDGSPAENQQNILEILNNPETNAWVTSKAEMKNGGPNYLPYLDGSLENQQNIPAILNNPETEAWVSSSKTQDAKPGLSYLQYLDDESPQQQQYPMSSRRPENVPITPHRGAYSVVPGEGPDRREMLNILPPPLDDSGGSNEDHALNDPTTQNLSTTLTGAPPTNNEGLTVATAIEEDSKMFMMEAQEVNREELEKKKMDEKKRKECRMVGYALIAICSIILGLSLGLTLRNRRTDPSPLLLTVAPSLVPSESPSLSPTGALDELITLLPNYALESLQTIDSPQQKALDWLKDHPNITTMEEWRKMQLFGLATFFHSMGGESWDKPKRDSWLQYDTKECNWFSNYYGAFQYDGDSKHFNPDMSDLWGYNNAPPTCDPAGRYLNIHVKSWPAQDALVSVPPEVELLSSLINLDLEETNLKGSLSEILPWENLLRMSNLRYLKFSNNEISGSIPSQLLAMSQLWGFEMGRNKINGTIPNGIGLMTNLRNFSLAYLPSLTGTIPADIGRMTNLRNIHLVDLPLITGSLPTQIFALPNLRKFEVLLPGSIPSALGLLTQLTHLALKDNEGITGRIPSELGLLAKLSELWLDSTSLTGSLPSELFSFVNMSYFRVSKNPHLTGTIPTQLGLMTDMVQLRLYMNKLTGKIPSQIGLMTRLAYIGVDGNELSGSIPTEVFALPGLMHVVLQYNHLTGSPLSAFANMPNIQDLLLHHNQFSGTVPSEIGLLTNCETITLSFNSFTGSLPTQISLLPKLNNLPLNDNLFSGKIPSQLGTMSNMYVLWFGGNAMTGSIPTDFGPTHLLALSLSGNNVTGSIPTELARSPHLQALYLDNTMINGTIPSELGSLSYLHVLDFSNSALGGTIPSELSKMSMNVLAIGGTSLTGTISEKHCSIESCDLWFDHHAPWLLPKFWCFFGWEAVPENCIYEPGSRDCRLEFDCSDQLCGCGCPC